MIKPWTFGCRGQSLKTGGRNSRPSRKNLLEKNFDKVHSNLIDTWDYQLFALLKRNRGSVSRLMLIWSVILVLI